MLLGLGDFFWPLVRMVSDCISCGKVYITKQENRERKGEREEGGAILGTSPLLTIDPFGAFRPHPNYAII
jgi:hypothetical protein